MRSLGSLLVLLVVLLPARAQEDTGGLVKAGEVWENDAYQVKAVAPEGWRQTLKEPREGGRWIDLVRYEEPRTKAVVTLSAQASRFTSPEAMIEWQSGLFKKDANLAVLREEVWGAKKTRPKGVFYEYSYHAGSGAQHAVAAFWVQQGRRFRVYGTVREVGWRSVGPDMEGFAQSIEFTGAVFSDRGPNYVDDAMNFGLSFPDGWRLRLPDSGPRVMFTSDRLGASVWVYAGRASGTLAANANRLVKDLRDEGAKITMEGKPHKHPALGVDCVYLEYTKKVDGTDYRYRETVIFHRDRLYRLVLAASARGFELADDTYQRMVESLSFMK